MKRRIFALFLTLALLLGVLPAAAAAGCTLTVTVPETKSFAAGQLFRLPLAEVFADPNGHTLTFALAEDSSGRAYIKDNVLIFTTPEPGEYRMAVTAVCTGGGTARAELTLTVTEAPRGDEAQYNYDETAQDSVRVYVTLSNNAVPLRGADDDGTALAHLTVDVPYFPLEAYGLSDFNRYHTDAESGSYIDNRLIERPTLLHLYIYLLERYYIGLPAAACGKGTSGLLDFSEPRTVADMFDNEENAYTADAHALSITGSATSLYMKEFWGHDENLMYYRNHVYPLMRPAWGATADYILLSDGDTVDLAMFSDWDFWSDGGAFACFDQDEYAVQQGGELTFRAQKYDTRSVADGGSETFEPITTLNVALYTPRWSIAPGYDTIISEENNGTYTINTDRLEPGVYYLMGLDGNAGTQDARIAPATARLVVQCTGEHMWDDGVVLRESTCTKEGARLYTCTRCGDTKTEAIATKPHSYTAAVTAPTCTADGYTTHTCTVCGASYTDSPVPAKGHTEIENPAVEPTCTQPGKTAGKHCSVCAAVLVEQKALPAKGHTVVEDPAVEATCTEPGKTAGKHCSVCAAVLVEQTVIPAKGHVEEVRNATAATCTVGGYSGDVYCAVCNTLLRRGTVVPAAGHTEVEDPAVEATCTEPGKTAGKHCSVCQTVLVEQTVIPAKGHTEVEDPAVEPTCTAPGKTAGKHCSVCQTILVEQTVIPAKGHTEVEDPAVEPTCTAPGKTAGKHCAVCSAILVEQKVIPAKGHAFANGTCTVCGAADPDWKAPEPETPWENPFGDVKQADWFYAGVKFANEHALFQGTAADTFSPDAPMTRGMLVTVLWRLDGKPAAAAAGRFADVAPAAYYAEAVAWASEQGVVNGIDATHFAPENEVTREQIAAILYRYAEKKGMNTQNRADLSVFPDAAQVSAYAKDALAWANAEGLVKGMAQSGRDYLAPQGHATRAQVATILARYAQSVVQ